MAFPFCPRGEQEEGDFFADIRVLQQQNKVLRKDFTLQRLLTTLWILRKGAGYGSHEPRARGIEHCALKTISEKHFFFSFFLPARSVHSETQSLQNSNAS